MRHPVFDAVVRSCCLLPGTGIAFIVDAIQQNRPYRHEMIQFLRDRFPEIRQADDTTPLHLAQTKANAK